MNFVSIKKMLFGMICFGEAILAINLLLPSTMQFIRSYSVLLGAMMLLALIGVLLVGDDVKKCTSLSRISWGLAVGIYGIVILFAFFLFSVHQEGFLTLEKLQDAEFRRRNISIGVGETWQLLLAHFRLGSSFFWGNLFLLFPLGLLGGLWRKEFSVWKILLGGLLLSLLVEGLQLLFGTGVFQLDIIHILRLVGCGLGIGVSRIPWMKQRFLEKGR